MDIPEDLRLQRERYRAMAKALERIEAEELRSMTDEEGLRRIGNLSPAVAPWRERPDWSGLVEQQALFHRTKR